MAGPVATVVRQHVHAVTVILKQLVPPHGLRSERRAFICSHARELVIYAFGTQRGSNTTRRHARPSA